MLNRIRSLVVFSCALLISLQAYAQRPLLIVGEPFPPFEFEQDGKVVGIDVDIAQTIFDRMGIPITVKLYPWQRAWQFVTAGEADAVFSTSRKEERQPFLIYPEENMWVSSFVFFVDKEKKAEQFTGYPDAKGQQVGVVRGNSYNDAFWQAELTTIEAKDLETNLKKLAGKRVDLVPADKIVGLYTAKLLGLQDSITFYPHELLAKGYPMPFVRKSDYPDIEQIAARYEAELKKLKADGTYDKIFTKWLGVEFK